MNTSVVIYTVDFSGYIFKGEEEEASDLGNSYHIW